MARKRTRVTKHHVLPTSRGGRDENNIVRWDSEFHSLYHQMFDNLTLDEVHQMLDIMSVAGTTWSRASISKLKKELIHGRIRTLGGGDD